MQRTYPGVWLWQLVADGQWRRIRVLLEQLPEHTLSEALLAGVLDAVRIGNWQRSGGKGRKPKPILDALRPRRRKKKSARHRTELTPQQIRERLDDLRRRNAGR